MFKKILSIFGPSKEELAAIKLREQQEQLAKKAAKEKRKKKLAARQAKKKAELEQKKIDELASMSPKDQATARGEPWVGVVDFKTNESNIKHGFFELDWNEYFIQVLKMEGYGVEGDPDEDIVSRWYRDICYSVAAEEGVDMTDRQVGFINVSKLPNNKSEVK